MAEITDLERALVNAHKAGDSEAATKLAAAIKEARQLEKFSGEKAIESYQKGRMSEDDAVKFERALDLGVVKLPSGVKREDVQPPGIMARIGDVFTGGLRRTKESESLPEWTGMPELNQLSMASAAAGLGTMFAGSDEAVNVLKSQFPGLGVRQDEAGNYILKSTVDKKEYVIPPGLRMGDIPRLIGGVAAFTPAGRVASLPGTMAASAGTQAAIESSQAATGGEFNATDVALAGGAAALPAVVQATKAGMKQAVKPLATRVVNAYDARQAAKTGATTGAPTTGAPPATGAAPVVPPAAVPPVAPVAPVTQAAAAVPEMAAEDVAQLVKKASRGGMGSDKAKEQLAQIAKINPEAKAAAEQLGFDLPTDIFSDNAMLKETVGLTRSVAGSEASAAWRETVEGAVNRADDLMGQLDASKDLASVSQGVKDTLGRTQQELKDAAKAIYDDIDAQVPKATRVEMPALQEELTKIASEVGEEGLSQTERNLMKMMGEDVTYGRLLREKSLIGAALEGKVTQNPYGNLDTASLTRLYRALADDQLNAVETIGGQELRDALRGANRLTAQRKALEKRIVSAFGKEGEGSIATTMRTAITSAAKGDDKGLTKLIKVVPPELRKQVIASAIADVAKSTRAGQVGFGFNEYAKMYQGLRNNSPVYATIVRELGDGSDEILTNLYKVSKRINEARANVLTTGKANQSIVQGLNAESIIEKVLASTTARAAATGVGALGGGPVGAVATSALTQVLASGKKDAIQAAGKLFASSEFEQLLKEAATKPAPSNEAINRVAASRALREFARHIKADVRTPTAREKWVRSTIQPARQTQSNDNRSNDNAASPQSF